MTSAHLKGNGVLVTRPRAQAGELLDQLQALGARPIAFPALEIVPLDPAAVAAAARNLPDPDITIFVSPNAVRYGLSFAADSRIGAIGPATAAALAAAGQATDILPVDGFDSESLLHASKLQNVTNQVVRIVRGTDGRQTLGDELRRRGARVEYLATYRRIAATPSQASLDEVEAAWLAGDIDAVVVMSVDTLRNLLLILPATCIEKFDRVRLVTPAARVIKDTLKRFPDARTELAAAPDTAAIIEALERTR